MTKTEVIYRWNYILIHTKTLGENTKKLIIETIKLLEEQSNDK